MKLPKIDRKPFPCHVDGIGELLVHYPPVRLIRNLGQDDDAMEAIMLHCLKEYDDAQAWIDELTSHELGAIFNAIVAQAPSLEAQAEGN